LDDSRLSVQEWQVVEEAGSVKAALKNTLCMLVLITKETKELFCEHILSVSASSQTGMLNADVTGVCEGPVVDVVLSGVVSYIGYHVT
jgi:hypothetical protein